MKVLLVGCGNEHGRRITLDGAISFEGDELILHDFSPDIEAHYDFDLNDLPYPLPDEEFDEIHAYGVLEHCGTQGDGDFFFGQFNEFHRALKPGGCMMLSVPIWNREVALGVPDHKRILPSSLFAFLTREYYENVGQPGYADYRHLMKGFWQLLGATEGAQELLYVGLKKV